MASVLAIEPSVRGFKSGQGDAFLRSIKIRSSLPSEGKWSSRPHLVRFYCMLNNPAEYERDISSAKSIISFAHILLICYCRALLVGLPESSDGQLGNFLLSTSFHHYFPCSYITCGWKICPLVAAVQRHSQTSTTRSVVEIDRRFRCAYCHNYLGIEYLLL
jgi:hypothetical protein